MTAYEPKKAAPIKFEWEDITTTHVRAYTTFRAKVHGGWLVNSRANDIYGKNISQSMTFFPDKNHEWEIEK